MELCYRGIAYAYIPPDVPMVETKVAAQFRGQLYRMRRPVYEPGQPKLNLVYRGLAYSTDGTALPMRYRQPPTYIARLSEQLGL